MGGGIGGRWDWWEVGLVGCRIGERLEVGSVGPPPMVGFGDWLVGRIVMRWYWWEVGLVGDVLSTCVKPLPHTVLYNSRLSPRFGLMIFHQRVCRFAFASKNYKRKLVFPCYGVTVLRHLNYIAFVWE